MKKTLILTAAVLSAAALSACGKMGDLQPPSGAVEGNRSAASRWTDRNADPATVNRPIGELPIEGGPSDPIGRRPQ